MWYKDVCNENLVTMLGMLRANQLGYLTISELNDAIDGIAPLSESYIGSLMAQVRERLPAFGRVAA
jgi:hypothetical protein